MFFVYKEAEEGSLGDVGVLQFPIPTAVEVLSWSWEPSSGLPCGWEGTSHWGLVPPGMPARGSQPAEGGIAQMHLFNTLKVGEGQIFNLLCWFDHVLRSGESEKRLSGPTGVFRKKLRYKGAVR